MKRATNETPPERKPQAALAAVEQDQMMLAFHLWHGGYNHFHRSPGLEYDAFAAGWDAARKEHTR